MRSNVGIVLHRIQTMWLGWRERRRQDQIDRALYKKGEAKKRSGTGIGPGGYGGSRS